MRIMGRHASAAVLVGLLVLSLGLLGWSAAAAQEATPEPDGMAMPPHPAHIHSGACDTLGAVAYSLTDLGMAGSMGHIRSGMMSGTPMAGGMTGMAEAGMMRGAATARTVETSISTVEATLDDLLAAPYAINVHWSAQEIERNIACGEIGGVVVDGDLLIGLHELNESGAVGVAWLHDNGDGTTTIAVFLAPGLFTR